MDASKTPAEVLALGRKIVEELNLEPGVDTLGRWMSHHLAELIRVAESAPSEDERLKKECEAAETISKLWAHRSSYENRINPFFELKPIIEAIRTLDPNYSPWLGRNDVTSQVYDTFRRLIICLLFRHVKTLDATSQATKNAQKTSLFQSDEERELITTLNTWIPLTEEAAQSKSSRAKRKSSEAEIDLDTIAREIVGEARSALDTVLTDLEKQTDKKKKKRGR